MNASIAVTTMARATEFYEPRLGLEPEETGADGSKVYASGGGASLHVSPSPDHAGRSTATLATWYVDDVAEMVEALAANEVAFEHYEGVLESGFDCGTDERGISARAGGGHIAWFKDPDGNIFAVEGDRERTRVSAGARRGTRVSDPTPTRPRARGTWTARPSC